jgi:hypothetical protein
MRVTGQALSVAVLGGIAASSLGPTGSRLLLTHHAASGPGGGPLTAKALSVADLYAHGYRNAMIVGAALVLVGAAASLTRGRREPESARGQAVRLRGEAGCR